MPCYLCNTIEQNIRGAAGGDHLVQSGPAEVTSRNAQEPIAVTHFKCSECGSRWRYVDDPADAASGWQFLQRVR